MKKMTILVVEMLVVIQILVMNQLRESVDEPAAVEPETVAEIIKKRKIID
jgi:hypothetical protein